MFSKAERFPRAKPSGIPGPSSYDPHTPENEYKVGWRTEEGRPLGASTKENVATAAPPVKSMHTDWEARYQKAKSEIAEQRRKRAEAEGIAQGARRDVVVAQETINQLKKELERAQARSTRREETVSSSSKELADLSKKYQTLKLKYTSESHEAESTINDLRKANRVAEENNAQLKNEIESARSDTRVEELVQEHTVLQAEHSTLEQRVERMNDMMRVISDEYGRLYSSSVKKEAYELVQEGLVASKLRIIQLEGTVDRLRRLSEGKNEEQGELITELERSVAENAALESMVDYLTEDRRSSLDEQDRLRQDPIPAIDPLPVVDTRLLLDLALTHLDLATAHLGSKLSGTVADYSEVLLQHTELGATLSATRIELAALKSTLATTQTLHRGLEDLHSPCAGQIAELRAQVTLSKEREEEMKALRQTMKRLEEKSKQERENLKRANEVVTRNRIAEDALEEEIQSLRKTIVEYQDYQAMYEELKDAHDLVIARETVNQEELEKVNRDNALLMGHQNELGNDQKINYVEGLRREMVAIKQELATVRLLYNQARDQIENLVLENKSYKSLEGGLGASTRIRVMRKQPEGREVLAASVGRRRSVSHGR
ncbi:hypothetical protein P7C73_g1421, partial [Tremellales sp. Uapishka_1]